LEYDALSSSLAFTRDHRQLLASLDGLQPGESGRRRRKGHSGIAAARAEQVIGDEKLSQRQRIAMPHLAAIVVIAKLVRGQRTQVRQMLPDGVLQFRCVLAADITINVEKIHRTSTIAAEFETNASGLTLVMIAEVAKIRMGDSWAKYQADVQVSVGLIRMDSRSQRSRR